MAWQAPSFDEPCRGSCGGPSWPTGQSAEFFLRRAFGMTPFPRGSRALPVIEDRIDINIPFPARFSLLMPRGDMGGHFFHNRRHDADGAPVVAGPTGLRRFQGAAILRSGADLSIRCVIAESFGENFVATCLRGGVLAITLECDVIETLAAFGTMLEVDLESQILIAGDQRIPFVTAPGHREQLLKGWDGIDLIFEHGGAETAAFGAQQRLTRA